MIVNRWTICWLVFLATTFSHAEEPPNRLAKESSPYLLQHARNPVDWYPWGKEAFEAAKKQNKLIFLSVGYSSCHWCHVMERESFSNPAIAKLMNDNFICIKVDREERPEIDEIYMTALQDVLNSRGGWPMSMFLTSAGKPIFGGTYWPPTDRKVEGGTLQGFTSVLKRVIELNKTDHDTLVKQADRVAELTAKALAQPNATVELGELNQEVVAKAARSFDIDPVHGGFGQKYANYENTKFPRPSGLMFLLKYSAKHDDKELAKLIQLTLEKMAQGGIYDQIGGGFHRYSTERTWTVPHFEKMLYDNAQLVELYAEAYKIDPNPLYKQVIEQTLAFIDREMTSPDGLFYSALDADSNDVEGEYYVWEKQELDKLLGDSELAQDFRQAYVSATPNFEEKFIILKQQNPVADVAKFEPLRQKLLQVRAKRVKPFLDTKAITAWNGLMIGAYAKAGEVLKEPRYIQQAERSAKVLLDRARTETGRLLHLVPAKGAKEETYQPGYLDDYAFVIHGLLNLYDATQNKQWLADAGNLTNTMTTWFADPNGGGYYFTSKDHEELFARSMPFYDSATPSGNGMAALNFARLGKQAEAKAILRRFGSQLKEHPTAVPQMAEALMMMLGSDKALSAKMIELTPKNEKSKPRASKDVVEATIQRGSADNGVTPFTITLSIKEGWHIYAHEPGVDSLKPSATTITLSDASLNYPKGSEFDDPTSKPYRIYETTVKIPGTIPTAKLSDNLEIEIQVIACSGAQCLLPSTLTLKFPKPNPK